MIKKKQKTKKNSHLIHVFTNTKMIFVFAFISVSDLLIFVLASAHHHQALLLFHEKLIATITPNYEKKANNYGKTKILILFYSFVNLQEYDNVEKIE